MKKYLYPLLVFALLGVGVLYWLSDNLDELIAQAITQHGSAMTQARVGVEHVEIHPKSGKGVVSGLVIGNPKGFKTAHALRVERIEVDIDLATLDVGHHVIKLELTGYDQVVKTVQVRGNQTTSLRLQILDDQEREDGTFVATERNLLIADCGLRIDWFAAGSFSIRNL